VKAILIILPIALLFSSPCWAEIYKWTDEKGIIHFTTDGATVPKQYQQNPENKPTRESTLTSKDKIENAPDGTKTLEAYQFCSQARRLGQRLESARQQYSIYSIRKDVSPSALEYFSKAVLSAEEQLQQFEEKARKDGIPADWLRCQFKQENH
jgi:hypothetical protein